MDTIIPPQEMSEVLTASKNDYLYQIDTFLRHSTFYQIEKEVLTAIFNDCLFSDVLADIRNNEYLIIKGQSLYQGEFNLPLLRMKPDLQTSFKPNVYSHEKEQFSINITSVLTNNSTTDEEKKSMILALLHVYTDLDLYIEDIRELVVEYEGNNIKTAKVILASNNIQYKEEIDLTESVLVLDIPKSEAIWTFDPESPPSHAVKLLSPNTLIPYPQFTAFRNVKLGDDFQIHYTIRTEYGMFLNTSGHLLVKGSNVNEFKYVDHVIVLLSDDRTHNVHYRYNYLNKSYYQLNNTFIEDNNPGKVLELSMTYSQFLEYVESPEWIHHTTEEPIEDVVLAADFVELDYQGNVTRIIDLAKPEEHGFTNPSPLAKDLTLTNNRCKQKLWTVVEFKEDGVVTFLNIDLKTGKSRYVSTQREEYFIDEDDVLWVLGTRKVVRTTDMSDNNLVTVVDEDDDDGNDYALVVEKVWVEDIGNGTYVDGKIICIISNDTEYLGYPTMDNYGDDTPISFKVITLNKEENKKLITVCLDKFKADSNTTVYKDGQTGELKYYTNQIINIPITHDEIDYTVNGDPDRRALMQSGIISQLNNNINYGGREHAVHLFNIDGEPIMLTLMLQSYIDYNSYVVARTFDAITGAPLPTVSKFRYNKHRDIGNQPSYISNINGVIAVYEDSVILDTDCKFLVKDTNGYTQVKTRTAIRVEVQKAYCDYVTYNDDLIATASPYVVLFSVDANLNEAIVIA